MALAAAYLFEVLFFGDSMHLLIPRMATAGTGNLLNPTGDYVRSNKLLSKDPSLNTCS